AATPMIMPSAVSAVRMALRRSALTATTNVIRNDMAAPLRDAAALDGAVVAHQSVAERNHARAVLGDVGLVRHEDDGDAALDVEALEDAHHLDARLRVEIAGRLVGEQQRRVVHQRPRDGDALLLAAGELVRMVAEPVAETHGLQRLGGALPPIGSGGLARVEQRQLDVLDRGRARQQVEALEHEADLRVAHEREAAQRLHLHLAEVVGLRQVANGDDRVHRPAPRAPPAAPAPAPRFAPPPRRPNGISGDVVLGCAAAPGCDMPVTTWSPSFTSPSTIAVIAPSLTPV